MFTDFFYTLKRRKVPVSIVEWMTLMEALSKGCISNLDEFYYLARAILVKSEAYYDHYDVAFQEFFREVPYEYKLDKKLYDSFLVNGLFKEYGLNQPHEIQPDARIQRMAKVKRSLKKIIPASLLPSSPSKQDPIFYYEITRILREDLAKKGISINIHGKSYNSLIVQWYIEYLKGLQY